MATNRFLFDRNDFDQAAELAAIPAEERPQFSQMDLENAAHSAQQRGFEEGLATATQSLEAQIVRHFESFQTEVNSLHTAEVDRSAAAQKMAIDVAMGLLRKLMPELANQSSIQGVSQLVQQVMMDRFEEPRLIIRVHDSVLDALSNRLQSLAQQSGFRGQYALMADTALAPPDCRIEWSNGGVERSVARIWDNLQFSLSQLQAGLSPDAAASTLPPNESETP